MDCNNKTCSHTSSPTSDIREYLEYIADLNRRSREARERGESEVGILWLIHGKLLYGSTVVSLAKISGSRLIHATSHEQEWRKYQRNGMFPAWAYDQHPRGRVEYDTLRGEFEILIHPCLSPDEPLFEAIRESMHLPQTTRVIVDERYRCYVCRAKSECQ